MKPIHFEGQQAVLGAPSDWNAAEHGPCDGLPIVRVGELVVSYWKPTWRERMQIAFGGKVQMTVVGGQPPIDLSVDTAVKEA